MRALAFAAALMLAACNGEEVARETAAAPPTAAAGAPAIETVAEGLRFPWGLVFLPGGDMLVTEREGGVKRITAAGQVSDVPGGPSPVLQQGQSGLTDIALDPRFAENGLVYIAFMQGARDANNLALYRARYANGALTEGRVIFQASRRSGTNHPGGRMVFLADETLLFHVGVPDDQRDNAQDLSNHLGKVLRLTRDGAAPRDNPFVGRANARPEIWSYGHRNAMGLTRDPETGVVWEHENGPRGGDELNRIERGANYGWPRVTHGVEYNGAVITDVRTMEGMVDPVVVWTPSTAPSGMAVYRGDAFPAWRGGVLIGFLAGNDVRIVRDGATLQQEALNLAPGRRVRDVRVGPDGLVYVLTDYANGALLRVRPQAN